MTEEEWINSRDIDGMVQFVRGKGSERKHRLLAIGCCEPYRERHFHDEPLSAALDVALSFADGATVDQYRLNALARARELLESFGPYDFYATLGTPAWTCGDRHQVEEVPGKILNYFAFDIYTNSQLVVGPLLRCVFGNPFRPVKFDSHWRTPDALGLAQTMYESRDFANMPILGDALMDAGCADEQIIEHCRGNGPHVRGCWVVDLVLGKE